MGAVPHTRVRASAFATLGPTQMLLQYYCCECATPQPRFGRHCRPLFLYLRPRLPHLDIPNSVPVARGPRGPPLHARMSVPQRISSRKPRVWLFSLPAPWRQPWQHHDSVLSSKGSTCLLILRFPKANSNRPKLRSLAILNPRGPHAGHAIASLRPCAIFQHYWRD